MSVRVAQVEVSQAVAMETRRVLWEIYRRRAEGESLRRGRPKKVPKPRGCDGLTVFELDPDVTVRLLRWAEGEARRKSLERAMWPAATDRGRPQTTEGRSQRAGEVRSG